MLSFKIFSSNATKIPKIDYVIRNRFSYLLSVFSRRISALTLMVENQDTAVKIQFQRSWKEAVAVVQPYNDETVCMATALYVMQTAVATSSQLT